MKRFISLLFIAYVAVNNLCAYDFKSGDLYYNITSNVEPYTVAVTVENSLHMGYPNLIHVIIPEQVSYNGITYNVTSIGDDALYNSGGLLTVTIPNSVTSIGDDAFCNCSSLTSITIPESVTYIGGDAFKNTPWYNNQPDGLIYINKVLYRYKGTMPENTSIIVQDGTISIGGYAFHNCTGLTSVTIPNSVTSIGMSAFDGCIGLTSVTIPNSVTSIGKWTFDGTPWYDNQPDGVVYINRVLYCYKGTMPENTSIIVQDGTISISGRAFDGCTGLTSITIPNSVTSIGDMAFRKCGGLTSVTVSNSVTSIGQGAFFDCAGITSVIIGSSVIRISDYAFRNCTSLTSITCKGLTPPICETEVFHMGIKNIPVYIPCGTIEAYRNARGWNEFTNLQEPPMEYTITVQSADEAQGTSNLQSMTRNTDCEVTAVFSATPTFGYHFVRWSDGDTNASRTITLTQDTVLTAEFALDYSGQCGDNLYWQYSNNELTITGSGEMYSYGEPWYDYGGLVPWTLLRDSIQLVVLAEAETTIGANAFNGCRVLSSITIPEGITNVGENAFNNCEVLRTVVWNAKNCNNNWSSPFGNSAWNIDSFTFGNQVENIPSNLCNNMWQLTDIVIPGSVTSIGDNAFGGCTGLTSITIPESVTSIGDNAFGGCTGLTSITIPESVTSIGDNTFGSCYGLTAVEILGYASLSGEPFSGCSNLRKIVCKKGVDIWSGERGVLSGLSRLDTLVISAAAFDVREENWALQPKNLRYIRICGGELTDNAFNVILRNYKTLGTLDLANATNTTISDKAFQECYNLRSLTLPSQLAAIPYKAVADCQLLQSITIPATVEEIDNSAFENCRSIQSIVFEGAAPAGDMQYAPAASSSALWRIGNWAFYNCHELQHLDIPEGVTEIGDAAFYGCVYLEDMTLPSSVQRIGDNTFALCAKLQKITVNAPVPPAIQAKTFYDVNRAIPVYVPEDAVADYKADEYWREFNIIGADAPMGIDQAAADNTKVSKVLRNGQVLIQRNDKLYTLMGELVNL